MTTTQSLGVDARAGCVVVGLRDVRSREIYALDAGRHRWVVGTNPSADVRLADACVSNIHCTFERKPNGALIVRDAQSRNGTYIDGNAIEAAELRIGSYLRLGDTTLLATASPSEPHRHAIELMRGGDPALHMTIERALAAARVDCNVLVLGETGTGKDLLARIVHESSRQSRGPFVAVNCGSIARELVASELFGHERGAFTGATEARDGWFVEASGGTLFLDEIGELPLELQPHLLRVLETKRVRRVGGTSERAIDVRIVAATNQLDGLGTERSRLRPDLYHRLATVVLTLTPLRERMADLGELVDGMLADLAPQYGAKTVTADAWEALGCYDWPGNIRELSKAVQRAVALGGAVLGADDFFPDFGRHSYRRHVVSRPASAYVAPAGPFELKAHDGPGGDRCAMLPAYRIALRSAMEHALAEHGTIRAAAEAIGMPKSTFADKARAWGLVPRRKVRIR